MKPNRCAVLFAALFLSFNHASAEEVLPIEPVYQRTAVWCWVAVGEMVFRYYDIPAINPDYQCGIIAPIHPACGANCYSCQTGSGTAENIKYMIENYPTIAASITNDRGRNLQTTLSYRALPWEHLKREIDAGRPVIAGITPGSHVMLGLSAHAVLIVGYDADLSSLIVNDPYPYDLDANATNPYLENDGEEREEGQYLINYNIFKNRLHWQHSFKNIRCTGSTCP